jgi:hypothetical protein
MALLGDDMQIDVRGFRHELLDRQVIQVLAQTMQSGPSDDGLRDPVLTNIGRRRTGSVASREIHDGRTEVPGKLKARFQRSLSFRILVAPARNMQNVQLCAERLRKPGSANDQVTRLGVRANADGDLLRDARVTR